MIKEDSLKGRLNHLFDTDPRTDSAIADALGVSKQAVSGWRQGVRTPRDNMIDVIAKEFGVSALWLRYGDRYTTVVSVTGEPPTDLSDEEKILVAKYRTATEERRRIVMQILSNE